MPVFYAYTNARVRSMRGELLSPSIYEQLIDSVDVMAAAAVLQGTEYRADIETGLLHRPGIDGVEDGLRRHLSRSFRKLRAACIGDARPMVELLLGRWDVQNLKTVLRGKSVGVGSQEVMDEVVPAGKLSEDDLETLAAQPDVRALVDTLATWGNPLAAPLMDNMGEFQRGGDLTELELALDKFYYSWALGRAAGMRESLDVKLVRDALRLLIDVTNIVTLLKVSSSGGHDPQRLFVEGGKEVGIDRLTQLLEVGGVEEVLQGLRDTRYGAALEREREEFRSTGRINRLERAMEEEVFRYSSRMFIISPLSISLAIGYMWSKSNEVVNVRIIMRGKAAGLERSRLREGLLVA